MQYEHAVIELTQHKDVLDRLRRLGIIKKDAQRAGKEYYQTLFSGQPINFYVGEPRTFPAEIGRALENSNLTYLDEKCSHCKGNGSTVAGICVNCKGRKLIKSDQMYRTLKVTRTYDAMLIAPALLNALPQNVPQVNATVISDSDSDG